MKFAFHSTPQNHQETFANTLPLEKYQFCYTVLKQCGTLLLFANIWLKNFLPTTGGSMIKLHVRSPRSISAEMHSGFQNLRQNMPMNCRAKLPGKGMDIGVQKDIDRITAIWRECQQKFGSGGDMLFGNFTIADAMFAPVALRFITYAVQIDPIAKEYVEAILALPAMQEWIQAALAEVESIPNFEY